MSAQAAVDAPASANSRGRKTKLKRRQLETLRTPMACSRDRLSLLSVAVERSFASHFAEECTGLYDGDGYLGIMGRSYCVFFRLADAVLCFLVHR